MEQVTFDPVSHTYWYKGIRYISATQIIDRFKPRFDTEGISRVFADKAGHTPEYWQQEWGRKNKQALERGTALHELRESVTLNLTYEVLKGKPYRTYNTDLFPVPLPLSMYPDGVYTEQTMHHHGYRIAGRPDKIYLETLDGKRYIHIDDYKTNQVIRTKGWYLKDGTTEKMLGALRHLDNCELTIYTLQLSLYMFMAEAQGFIPGNMRLIHYPSIPRFILDGLPGAITQKPREIPITYSKKDVLLMLRRLQAA